MPSGKKQIDVARLKADLAAASVELLSAHCATDRIRLQYSPRDIVTFAERNSLNNTITSAAAVYFSTRMKSPVEALTDTVNLDPSRLAP